MPDGCPPVLARLIHDCWRQSPAARPSFEEIVVRIERMQQHDAFKALPLPKGPASVAGDGGSSNPAALHKTHLTIPDPPIALDPITIRLQTM